MTLNHYVRCAALRCMNAAVLYAAKTVPLCRECALHVRRHLNHAKELPSRPPREPVAQTPLRRPKSHAEMDHSQPSIVYYAQVSDLVKIGSTTNPRSRWSTLRRQYGDDFTILAVEPGRLAEEIERHARFVGLRVGMSEWFRFEGALREHVAQLVKDRPDWANLAHEAHEAAKLRVTGKSGRKGNLKIP